MSRPLTIFLEPSDALLGLLRMKAAAESGRWPLDLSTRLRSCIDTEVQRLSQAIEAMGLCIQYLEAHGIAQTDRRPQSRFSDVDGALHLIACAVEISVDLDNLKLAIERGDDHTRENTKHLTASLRGLLWALVRSDLVNCPRLLLSGVDQPPDRALRFFDAYLSTAWAGDAPPEIALPPRDRGLSSVHPRPLEVSPAADPRTDPSGQLGDLVLPLVTPALPRIDPASVFGVSSETVGGSIEDLAAAATASTEVGLLSLGLDRTPFSLRRAAQQDSWAAHPDHETLDFDQIKIDRHAPLGDGPEGLSSATVQLSSTDILSEDARFFIVTSGLRWPCDPAALDAARARLMASTDTPADGIEGHAFAIDRLQRIDRGYDELCLLSAQSH